MAYIKTGLSGGGNGVTLTVSCEEDFLGETLTLSDGTTTLTSVVSSTLSVVFDITESGTWTLTNSLTSESIPFYIETEYSATLSAIPDGKTVTPINDITIWQKCAGLTPVYTSLGEILNDSGYVATLMSDDNAVDYMVRSTTWAVATALVPTMTSNTTPSGTASGSSEESGYAAYRAFDGDDNTDFRINTASAGWVQYEFTSAVIATKAFINITYAGSTVTGAILASNDGVNFDTLDTATVATSPYTFNLNNTSPYKIYRYQFSRTSTGSFPLMTLQFYSTSITTSEIAMRYISASDYASYTLLSDSTWFTAINNSTYKDYLINTSVPTMTGYTTPAGEVIYSNEYSSKYLAWYAFDKGSNGQWEPSGMAGNYIGYDFKKNVSITNFSYQGATGQYSSWSFKDFKLQGSNDNANWYDVENFTYTSLGNVQSFVLNAGSDIYNSFRLYCVNGNGGTDGCATEVQLYGHEYGGVQTWLRAADITNKLYTSLSEVLNDTATLSTLMASEDAVDYLVTAKSWINSKELVPTMTSNTAPSGTCFGKDKYGSQDYYFAFDKNDSTGIHSSNYSSATDWWIGYKFDIINNVSRVDYVFSQAQSTAITFTVKVQSSMDGITWVDASDVKTLSIPAGGEQKISGSIDLTSNCQASWFRIYTNGIGVSVLTLQFCTASITESESAMTAIGLSNYASNTLLADEDWRTGICNSEYFESILNVKVPTMTSATTPSGQVYANPTYQTNYGYYAFDDNSSTMWLGSTPPASYSGNYIAYRFPTVKTIYMARIRQYIGAATEDAQATADIQAGISNADFETVKSNITWYQRSSGLNWYTFAFDTIKTNCDTFRILYISGTQANALCSGMSELQFYGREDV